MTSTRRWLITLFLAVLAGVVRAGEQDFTLVNKTGVEIHHVFVSPSSKSDWDEDILGEDTLPSGESVDIEFDADEEIELWDLKITDGDGGAIVWTQLNLLEISKLTLFYDAETKKATAKAE